MTAPKNHSNDPIDHSSNFTPAFQNPSPNNSMKHRQNARSRTECQICGKRAHTLHLGVGIAKICLIRHTKIFFKFPPCSPCKMLMVPMSLDTGTNAHMINNLGMLTNLIPQIGSDKAIIGDGNKVNVFHIGDAPIKSTYGSVKL